MTTVRTLTVKRGKKVTAMYYLGNGKQTPVEQTIITDGCDCLPWHEVFAWLPVKTIHGKYVWGQKVYRRKVWIVWGTGFHMEPETQYSTLFEMLKHGTD